MEGIKTMNVIENIISRYVTRHSQFWVCNEMEILVISIIGLIINLILLVYSMRVYRKGVDMEQ
jgi:hypothetical protein